MPLTNGILPRPMARVLSSILVRQIATSNCRCTISPRTLLIATASSSVRSPFLILQAPHHDFSVCSLDPSLNRAPILHLFFRSLFPFLPFILEQTCTQGTPCVIILSNSLYTGSGKTYWVHFTATSLTTQNLQVHHQIASFASNLCLDDG
jgi:hypothetical protein